MVNARKALYIRGKADEIWGAIIKNKEIDRSEILKIICFSGAFFMQKTFFLVN
ncbi:hypothetical protein M5361_13370 [Ligilactobacillus agilis]|nr:hypothetical protein [Ligilactobacillus agilis]